MNIYFSYGENEVAYLSKRCPKLGALMERLGPLQRSVTPDPFVALLNSVIAQQISIKAAATVCSRFTALAMDQHGAITPRSVGQLSPESVQQCGMSMRKAGYIIGIAQAAQEGSVDFDALAGMSDADVVRTLSALHGVGVWTAEMLLIFSLHRPDVLSWLDLGIRKGLMALYNKKQLTEKQFAVYRKRFSPHGSVASLYLWALAGQ